MKKSGLILFAMCLCFLSLNAVHAEEVTLNNVKARVYFSPDGGCTAAIINEIQNAKDEILVQAYSFSSKEISSALIAAFKRNVKIAVILDKKERAEKDSEASFLAKKKVPVYIDAKHSTAHNKVMIIDKTTVITGSMNLIKAAESENAENLLIIPSKELASVYIANWQKHKDHSERYKAK
jgi:phosphatidylserine/phosphatidylglycerophosphate/cardiolipin synthase-like enzyme